MKTKNKIIFLRENELLEKDYIRFDIDFLSKFFHVLVFNCFSYFNYKTGSKNNYSKKKIKKAFVYDINSLKDVPYISDTSRVYIIDFLKNDFRSYFLKKKIISQNSIHILYQSGLLPSNLDGTIHRQPLNKRLNKLYKNPHQIQKIIEILLHRIFKLKNKISPDLILAGGQYGLELIKNNKEINIIRSHSFDYDESIKIKKRKRKYNYKYYVFLDENIVSHNDYITTNVESPISKSEYYSKLLKFLYNLELATGHKVIIALHPSSDIREYSDIFKDFVVTKNITGEVVKYSLGVMAHASTSISFSIIYDKPLYFVTSKSLDKSWIGVRMRFLSKLLKRPLISLEDSTFRILGKVKNKKIIKKNYKDYFNNYIKCPNSKEVLISRQLVNYINSEK